MDAKDLLKLFVAILALGGAMYFALAGYNQPPPFNTEAWSVPSSTIYAQVLPPPQWLYAGDSAACIWEIHPNTTKTINSVSYGTPGSYTSCTQSSTDWLLWTCDSVSAAEGNVTCQPVRVVQNEFPGTSEMIFTQNMTFQTASVKGSRFPGCTSADCTITSGASIAAGNYFQRNLNIQAALTFNGNVNITTMENFTITNTGSISITAANPVYTLNISAYNFSNAGTISGYGYYGGDGGCGCYMTDCGYGYGCVGAYCNPGGLGGSGPNFIFNVAYFTNTATGYVITNGGAGGSSCGTVYSCGLCSGTGGDGGKGGAITFNIFSEFNNAGTINALGNIGGNGPNYWFYQGQAGKGGNGGNLTKNFYRFNNTGTISTNGGNPGSGYFGAAGGAGGTNVLNISSNITVSNYMTAAAGSGGTAGTWTINYNNNSTGMDWVKITPTPTATVSDLVAKPSITILAPNATTNTIAYLQNQSISISYMIDSLRISYSMDNGSTWEELSGDYYSFPYNSSNLGVFSMDSHRRGTDFANYSKLRVMTYRASTQTFGDAQYIGFNLTDMATTLSGTAIPNGTISTNTIRFSCNYSNSSGYGLEAATAYLNLDGVKYAMTPNATSKTYYWDNTQNLLAGSHWWQCELDKANYRNLTSANTSFNITGFGIFYPVGQTSAKLTCPFPTISGMVPAGQKAGIGIFRIVNYNNTALHNYTLFLNNTPPSGATVYARCDAFSASLAGWTALSTTAGYKGLLNINSTNSSAYCWLRLDCVGVAPGQYIPIGYVFTEE
jgi:hypothetical protein